MAGANEDFDLNSRERRLAARRVQQQQLLGHLAATMMQGQASSSSSDPAPGGIEAVGHMLVNWSKDRKQPQAKKVPKLIPPPPKSTPSPAAPPLAEPAAPTQPKTTPTPPWATTPWAVPGLNNEQAIAALQQLGDQVKKKLDEEKEKEENNWYRTAAKEEEAETEPPSCEEPTGEAPAEVKEEATQKVAERKVDNPEDKAAEGRGKKEDSPVEDPDWGGSNSPAPTEGQPPEENEPTPEIDSDSSGKLATMSEKQLLRSLKVSYQAAIRNLKDAQKKEEMLGLTQRSSTHCIKVLMEKVHKKKRRDVRDEPSREEASRGKRRRKKN